mgnify:CR=1 FL=1
MKKFLLLLLITFWFYQCTNTETEQDQTTKETLDSSKTVTKVAPETIPAKTTDFEQQTGAFHKQLPYMMFVNDQVYFIVTSKNWQENKGNSDKQDTASTGTYKVGLVNKLNEIIIPIKYDKIYNMGGVAANLIEVELNGKLGAYDINGKELLKAEFDGIYPYTNAKDVWVQIRKGDQFGWLSTSGSFSMNPSSHSNKALFKAQSVANLFTNWSFDSKSEQIIPLFEAQVDPKDQHEIERGGILVFPSYLFKNNSTKALYGIGLLNGLLPCGLVYAGLAGAIATGQGWMGALYMICFGLGTLPIMVLASQFRGLISINVRNY